MTIVFLDTNIVIAEQYFRSEKAMSFLKACQILGLQVVIPEIVLDEIKGNFSKRLKAALNTQKQNLRELNKFTDEKVPLPDETETIQRYNEHLISIIEEHDIEIEAYPEIDLKNIVSLQYKERKPFKEKGDGIKDYLVWKSICNKLSEKGCEGRFYFLTTNHSDFCKSSVEISVLHEDLLQDLQGKNLEPIVYKSITHFWGEIVASELENIEIGELPRLGLIEIEEFTDSVIENELLNRETFGFEGFPLSNDVLASIISPPHIQSTKLSKVDDEVVIVIEGTVTIKLTGFIEKSSYYLQDEDSNITILDNDWNNYVMHASASGETPFHLTIHYSIEDKDFTASSVEFPQEIFDDIY